MSDDKLMPGLDAIDKQILSIYARDPSLSQKAVADQIGISQNTISRRMRNPRLKSAVIDICGSLSEVLESAKGLAARRLKRLILSANEGIALKAVIETLKGDLHGPQQEHLNAPIKFVTIVNEVGVLESVRGEVVDTSLADPLPIPDAPGKSDSKAKKKSDPLGESSGDDPS